MGHMNNAQIEISNWLNSDRNYEDGVYLYEKYGKNPQLKRLFPGHQQRYEKKLAYELGKVIGIGFCEKPEDCSPLANPAVPVAPLPLADGDHSQADGKEQAERAEIAEEQAEEKAEKAEAASDQAEENADRAENEADRAEEQADRAEEQAEFAEEQANRAEEQAERAEDFAGKLETATATIGAIAKGEAVDSATYPPVINRIIAESSRLFNERAMLKKQQNAVPDENTDENKARRKELIGQIDDISVRLEVLYQAKAAYLEGGQMPEEKVLFPPDQEAIAEETDKAKLLQKRNNLRSQVTRARNMLEYQTQSKGKTLNPMPKCPKRTELEKRIKGKEKEIADLEAKLKDAD